MSRLKQILPNLCRMNSNRILRIINDYTLHSLVPRNYQLVDIAGLMLSSLMLLGSTLLLLIATFILSLLFVMMWMWEKLTKLFQNTDRRGLWRQFTLWLLGARAIVTSRMAKVWRILPWKKDTVTVPDSTLTSLATPGELDLVDRIRKHQ